MRPLKLELSALRWCESGALLGVAVALLAPAAHADPVDVINDLREQGCGGRPGVGSSVRPHGALDDVAQALSRDGRLEDVFDQSSYPAASSSAFHVRGSRQDSAIRSMLAERFCASVNDPRYEEIGVFARGDETWIVLAVRAPPAPVLEPAAVARRVLELVNEARAAGRQCGRARHAPAQPLQLSDALNQAALVHARDMAARGSAGHRGSDGSFSGERITRAGYVWRASGENVAAGQPDANAVVGDWLESPDHCATLMAPYFVDTGVAFALAPDEEPEIYWAQVFAAPR